MSSIQQQQRKEKNTLSWIIFQVFVPFIIASVPAMSHTKEQDLWYCIYGSGDLILTVSSLALALIVDKYDKLTHDDLIQLLGIFIPYILCYIMFKNNTFDKNYEFKERDVYANILGFFFGMLILYQYDKSIEKRNKILLQNKRKKK